MSMIITQLSAQLVEKLIETKKRLPTRIKAATYLHFCPGHFPYKPCSLLEYTMQELIHRLFRLHGVAFVSTSRTDAPLKGANLYQHEFRTADNKPFYSHELCSSYPQSPIASVRQAICEMQAAQGCTGCAYGASLDEGEVCEFCRNGETRKALDTVIGDRTMRNLGWSEIAKAVGEEYAGVIEDLAKFHGKIVTDDDFRSECDKIVKESVESDSHRSYLGEAEDILFMNLKGFIDAMPDEDDEEDDGDDFNYDDLDEEPA